MKSTVTKKGTYRLDVFGSGYEKLIPLTEKNRDFVEGCIAIDSAYKSDIDDLVEKLKANYSYCALLKVIKEINRVNSTRLADTEMKEIVKRLIDNHYDLSKLINAFNGTESDIKDLFILIVKPLKFKTKTNKDRERRNISFATKFIFCLSKILSCSAYKNYSKYDSKVAECLPNYVDVYDISGYGEKDFEKNGLDENELWDMYLKYNECLTKLIDKVKVEHKYSISRKEIDHLIWYTQK